MGFGEKQDVLGPKDTDPLVKYSAKKQRFTIDPDGDDDDKRISVKSATSLIRIQHTERETWGSRAEFILTTVSMAVGVGNVWRFPYLVYGNGGGSFLIPYLMAMLVLGIPMFFLEQGIGQRFRKGNFHSMIEIDRRLKGVGLANAFVSTIGALYYNVLIAWSIWYLGYSFKITDLLWTENEARFWFHDVLEVSTGYFDFQSFNWKMMLFLLAAWVLIYFIIRKGIATTGKVVYATATLPYVFLLVLLVRGLTLDGSGDGVEFYLKPDFSYLGKPLVWSTAATQIFFSLSIGWGSIPAYGSYNDPSEDLQTDAFLVPLINSATSVLAGFVIFAILGNKAWQEGEPDVGKVVGNGGTGLAFITYPAGLGQLPGSAFWCICFFAMLVVLGVGSEFSMVEVIITLAKDLKWVKLTGVEEAEEEDVSPDTYGTSTDKRFTSLKLKKWRIPQPIFTAGVCLTGWIVGTLLFATSAGIYWFDFFNNWLAVSLTPIVFVECVAVAWVYGAEKFIDDLQVHIKTKIWKGFWCYLWKFWVPIILVAVTIANFIGTAQDPGGELAFSYLEKDGFIQVDYKEPGVAVALGYVLGYFPALILVVAACHEQFAMHREGQQKYNTNPF